MPIDPEFLRTLVCPKTHRPLREAEASELAAINRWIEAGDARNAGGEPVRERLDAGLVPDGERVLYPVRDEIPILLEQEAISLDGSSGSDSGGGDAS